MDITSEGLDFLFKLKLGFKKRIMSGGTSVFNMLSSLKNNRNIRSGRSKLGDNPYCSKSVDSEKRNSTYNKELIAHRFEKKDSAIRLTKWVYAASGLVIIGCLAYFLFSS